MKLQTELYRTQSARWPVEGAHILAHFDDFSIIVYQAYRKTIADYAVKNGQFGGNDFSYARMSWIKPNFLWMMYRCGWAIKPDQEAVLGLRLRRTFFDSLLEQAVVSSFDPTRYSDRPAWEAAVARSDVRLQWDPDHHPNGAKQTRRAIQLGLRGPALDAMGKREILEVVDLTDFVSEQREFAGGSIESLMMPSEKVYRPAKESTSLQIGLSPIPEP